MPDVWYSILDPSSFPPLHVYNNTGPKEYKVWKHTGGTSCLLDVPPFWSVTKLCILQLPYMKNHWRFPESVLSYCGRPHLSIILSTAFQKGPPEGKWKRRKQKAETESWRGKLKWKAETESWNPYCTSTGTQGHLKIISGQAKELHSSRLGCVEWESRCGCLIIDSRVLLYYLWFDIWRHIFTTVAYFRSYNIFIRTGQALLGSLGSIWVWDV